LLVAAIVTAAASLVASTGPASGDESAAPTLRIAARDAEIKTVGSPRGKAWNLFSNGEIGAHIFFPRDGRYEVVVRARGSAAEGVWPTAELRLDGDVEHGFSVGSETFRDYRKTISAKQGIHLLTVAFTNDRFTSNEDRNLYVAEISIRNLEGTVRPRLARWSEWAAEAEKREREALERAAASAEEVRKGDAVVTVLDASGRPVAGARVRAEQTRHDFLFGCNIYMFDKFRTKRDNEEYKRRFAELFNYATLGFYWRWYERERGKPNYPYTDKVVEWCLAHGIRMKGHPLLWATRAGIPRWSDGQPPPEVRKRRVQEIIRRYRGKIEFWEVLNEPAHARGLKVEECYPWAREADPNAVLIINDYHVMADGYPRFFHLLKRAIEEGVPFDGIGIQAHEPRTMRFPLDRCWKILDHYATLGKQLHITEFTPTSGGQPITGSYKRGRWDEATQAEWAEKFYRLCFGHPAVVAITWWDLCDRGSWLKGGGLLRADLSPKPAYEALYRLIHKEWHTSANGKTDRDGVFRFRGYYGRYRVEADGPDGASGEAEFHLARGADNRVTVRLAGHGSRRPEARGER